MRCAPRAERPFLGHVRDGNASSRHGVVSTSGRGPRHDRWVAGRSFVRCGARGGWMLKGLFAAGASSALVVVPAVAAGSAVLRVAARSQVTVFVANLGSSTVTPIGAASGRALAAITVGLSPGALVVSPDGKTVYVAGNLPGMTPSAAAARPISAVTREAGKLIRGIGLFPRMMGVTPNGGTLYIGSCCQSMASG